MAVVGLGWTSSEITSVSFDSLWKALMEKTRNPQKFMNVSDVTVVDRKGYLARAMTMNVSQKRVEDHIYIDAKKGEIVYRAVDPNTKQETDDEKVTEVKQNPLRLEFFHRHAKDGYRKFWQAPVDVVQKMVQEVVNIASRPSIKFTYFNVEGGGECIRLAFVLGGVPFIDDRIDMPTQWKAMKPLAKFGQLPLITVNDSEQIAQSAGMLRFASQLGGLIPEDPVEALRVEEVLGLSWDLVTAITPSMQLDRRPQLYGYEGTAPAELTKRAVALREGLSAPGGDIDRFLGYLDGLLAKNGTGWFVGNKPTMAECEVIPRLRSLRKGNRDGFPREIVDKHKNLVRMYLAFHDLPVIREHYKGVPPY